MKLKRTTIILAIGIALYSIGITAFLVLSRTGDDQPLHETIINYIIVLFVAPCIGTLLAGWGRFALRGKYGVLIGILPSPIVGFAGIIIGVALTFAFPLSIFFSEEIISFKDALRGGFAVSLNLLVGAATLITFGGQYGDEFPNLRRLYLSLRKMLLDDQ